MALLTKNVHDLLAAGSRMDDFGRADRRQVAVALVGEDHLVRMDPLDAGRDGRCAAVGSLDHVAGEIFIIVVGAADRRDADGRVEDVHLAHALRR